MSYKNKIVIGLFCLSYTALACSMQPMNDRQLGEAIGQDGVTVELNFKKSTIAYDQLIITHKALPTDPSASLVIMPNDLSDTSGIRFYQSATGDALAQQNLTVHADSEGGVSPVYNVNIKLPHDAHRVRITPFALYLVKGSELIDRNALPTPIFSIGTHGLDFVFKQGDTLGLNLQLGNVPQKHMLKVMSGSLLCIASNNMCASTNLDDGQNPIQIHSKNGSAMSSLKFGLKMTASDQTTGFRLYDSDDFEGFGMDIVNDGLLISGQGTTDKFNVNLSHLIMGGKGQSNSNQFNNLKNGSIGNLGLEGVAVKDFKMLIKGL